MSEAPTPASPPKPTRPRRTLLDHSNGGFVCNTLQHPVTFYDDAGVRTPDRDIPLCPSGYYLKLATSDEREDTSAPDFAHYNPTTPEFGHYQGVWHRPFTHLIAFNPTTKHVLDIKDDLTFYHIFGPLNCPDDTLLLRPKLFIVSLPVFQFLNTNDSRLCRRLREAPTVHIASPDTDLGAVRNDKGSVIGTKRLVFYV